MAQKLQQQDQSYLLLLQQQPKPLPPATNRPQSPQQLLIQEKTKSPQQLTSDPKGPATIGEVKPSSVAMTLLLNATIACAAADINSFKNTIYCRVCISVGCVA